MMFLNLRVWEPHPHAQDEETTKQANNKCSAVYTHVIKPWCSDEGKSPNGLCNAELGPVLVLLS